MVAPPTINARLWTPEDLQELPEDADWRRYEIVDGALVVSPAPGNDHNAVTALLRRIVDRAAPDDLIAADAYGVALGSSFRVPDIVVLRLPLPDRSAITVQPSDVLLAVEVVSPSSVTTDRITKPAQYAAGGIGAYWRVETDPVSLTAYELTDEVYREVGTWGVGETARLTVPFDVEIEIDRLT